MHFATPEQLLLQASYVTNAYQELRKQAIDKDHPYALPYLNDAHRDAVQALDTLASLATDQIKEA